MTKVPGGAPARDARWGRWLRTLFTLEARPPYLRLALRGTLGLMAPLAIGAALGWPALNAMAFAAFLLAFGDLTEDHGWLARLAAGSVFGGLAVGAGVLLGTTPVSASLGAFALGVAFGLAGAYGDGAAAHLGRLNGAVLGSGGSSAPASRRRSAPAPRSSVGAWRVRP